MSQKLKGPETHLVRVRWRKALDVSFSEAAGLQMVPEELRNNPGTKTAAQAMTPPGQT